MHRFPHVLAPLALIVGVGLALTGCSEPVEAKLDPVDSPLAEFLGGGFGVQSAETQVEQAREVEELVAACMAEQGFEYIPVDQSQYTAFLEEENRDTEEWVAAHGYGVNMTDEETSARYGEFEDPNAEYVASLSRVEAEAYYEAQWGIPPKENADGSYEYNWEEAGCVGAAEHKVKGEQAYDEEEFQPILEAINDLYESVSKDPRVKKLDADWAACMADAGFTEFTTQQDAAHSIYQAMNDSANYQAEIGEPADEETFQAARELEIDTALSDFRCKEKFDYDSAKLAVQFELEEKFIEDHETELDALRAFNERN